MYFLSIKKMLYAVLISLGIINMINIQALQDQQEDKNHVGEIMEVVVQIKGLVGTASITGVINALQSIKGVSRVIITDFKHGVMTVVLSDSNNLFLVDLQRKIIQTVNKSQCLCDAVKEVKATGVLEEDEQGFFLHVGRTGEKLHILTGHTNFKKFKSKIQSLSGKKSMVTLVGVGHSHSDGVVVIDSIRDLRSINSNF